MESVEVIISLRRLYFLAGKKWRKEPGKGGSPFAILPPNGALYKSERSTVSTVCGLRATSSRVAAVGLCAVSFPRSRVPTKVRRNQFLVGPARNGVETNPQPLTKSIGDLGLSFERTTAQGVPPHSARGDPPQSGGRAFLAGRIPKGGALRRVFCPAFSARAEKAGRRRQEKEFRKLQPDTKTTGRKTIFQPVAFRFQTMYWSVSTISPSRK